MSIFLPLIIGLFCCYNFTVGFCHRCCLTYCPAAGFLATVMIEVVINTSKSKVLNMYIYNFSIAADLATFQLAAILHKPSHKQLPQEIITDHLVLEQ